MLKLYWDFLKNWCEMAFFPDIMEPLWIWMLLQSVSQKKADIWIDDKRDTIGDPEFCDIYSIMRGIRLVFGRSAPAGPHPAVDRQPERHIQGQ